MLLIEYVDTRASPGSGDSQRSKWAEVAPPISTDHCHDQQERYDRYCANDHYEDVASFHAHSNLIIYGAGPLQT